MSDKAAEDGTGPGDPGIGQPRLRQFQQFFAQEFLPIRYAVWGEADAPRRAVLVHGFMQNGREFDPLAAALAARGWQVYCPDLPGHGWSGRRSTGDYGYLLYAATVGTMMAMAGSPGVDLLGNSMGATIAMLIAAAKGVPLRTLVLNDGSVQWEKGGIRHFLGATPGTNRFADQATAERAVMALLDERGPLSAADRQAVIGYSLVQFRGIWFGLFDPRLRYAMGAVDSGEPDYRSHWTRIAVPTLLVRGARSTMLSPGTAAEMIATQPKAELLEMPGVGHSPWLRTADQIDPVVDWLARH